MEEEHAAQRLDELLRAAYPDAQQRVHATRWLGWIAYRSGTGGRVDWWEIPAWVCAPELLTARRLAAWTVVVVWACLSIAATPWAAILVAILLWVLVGKLVLGRIGERRGPMVLPAGHPRAVVVRRPRRSEAGLLLQSAFPLIVTFAPALVRLWTVPAVARPKASAVSTYRADRLASVLTGVAWAPLGVVPAALLAFLPCGASGRWLAVVLLTALGSGIFFGLMTGRYPLLKLTELVLAAQWRQRVGFLCLLEDAAQRQVVRHSGAGYEFRDDAARARLAALGQAALSEHALQQARQSARTGIRSRAIAALPSRAVTRISIDLGVGAGAFAATAWAVAVRSEHGSVQAMVSAVVIGGGLVGYLAFRIAAASLRAIVTGARWTLANVPAAPRAARYAAGTAAAASAGVIVAEFGTAVAAGLAAVLPAAFVAACGGWAGLFVRRKLRALRWRGNWLRLPPDVIAVTTTAAALLLLVKRDLLATQPASGLLFPPAVWGSFRIWRAMNCSARLTVRAAADITLSLMVGAELVLSGVWLANLLGLPRPEVAGLRSVLGQVGAIADLPWWVWTGLYVVLAGAGLAFVVWPARLAKIVRWFRRARVVLTANATRRVASCVHIGLMAAALIGITAPTALAATFQRQLRTAYTVALQREFEARGELAAYTWIRQQSSATLSQTLIALVRDIHETSTPTDGDPDATPAETDLARRLGGLQALVLGLKGSPGVSAAGQAAAKLAGFDEPVHDEADLDDRLGKVDAQEKEGDEAANRAEQAGDLAAAAIASTISIPHISGGEVVQIVREYLGGLIEGSPLKDVFAAWAEHLGGRRSPPGADAMLIPDPKRLEQAASAALSAQFIRDGGADPVTDPFAADPAVTRAMNESPLDAAVDMTNQARFLEEGSGPCAGCMPPENPDKPVEPPEEDHGAP